MSGYNCDLQSILIKRIRPQKQNKNYKTQKINKKCKIKVETTTIICKTHKPSKNIVKNTNKKTSDKKREDARLRKQKQREALKSKYGDEEYKKKHAQEIADYRKLKKETNN